MFSLIDPRVAGWSDIGDVVPWGEALGPAEGLIKQASCRRKSKNTSDRLSRNSQALSLASVEEYNDCKEFDGK